MKYDSRCSRHARFIIFLRVHYHNSIVHEIGRVVSPMTRRVARRDRCGRCGASTAPIRRNSRANQPRLRLTLSCTDHAPSLRAEQRGLFLPAWDTSSCARGSLRRRALGRAVKYSLFLRRSYRARMALMVIAISEWWLLYIISLYTERRLFLENVDV